jgi:Domain of unknown function (DUF4249)
MAVRFKKNISTIGKCYLLSLSFFVFIACQEEVTIPLKSSDIVRVAADGRITDENIIHTFRLTKTIGYLDNIDVPPLLDANAYILEQGTGNKYGLTLIDNVHGIYQTPKFKGIAGETYSFYLDCSIGTFKATSFLDSVTKLDSIKCTYQYNKEFKMGFYKVYLSAYDPPIKNYYRFSVYLNDTLVNYKITDASFTSDELFNGMYMANIEIFDMRQEWVKSKINRLKVEMLSISKEEYDDINDFISEINGSGSIFAGPSANIPSNLKNTSGGYDGLGFIGASAVSSKEILILKQHADSTNDPKFRP